MEDIGKVLIGFGVTGMIFIGKVPGIGRLPGDIVIQRDNLSCIFPLGTYIVISVGLTLLLNFLLCIHYR